MPTTEVDVADDVDECLDTLYRIVGTSAGTLGFCTHEMRVTTVRLGLDYVEWRRSDREQLRVATILEGLSALCDEPADAWAERGSTLNQYEIDAILGEFPTAYWSVTPGLDAAEPRFLPRHARVEREAIKLASRAEGDGLARWGRAPGVATVIFVDADAPILAAAIGDILAIIALSKTAMSYQSLLICELARPFALGDGVAVPFQHVEAKLRHIQEELESIAALNRLVGRLVDEFLETATGKDREAGWSSWRLGCHIASRRC